MSNFETKFKEAVQCYVDGIIDNIYDGQKHKVKSNKLNSDVKRYMRLFLISNCDKVIKNVVNETIGRNQT